MSARSKVTGPGRPPMSVPSTPVLPILVRTSLKGSLASSRFDEPRRLELDQRELGSPVQEPADAEKLVGGIAPGKRHGHSSSTAARAPGAGLGFSHGERGGVPAPHILTKDSRPGGPGWPKRSSRRRSSDTGSATSNCAGCFGICICSGQLDNRGFQLNRQGKIPFATGSEGHEGIHAGARSHSSAAATSSSRTTATSGSAWGSVTSARRHALMFARGKDRSGGRQFPNHFTDRARGIMSISSIIAAQCTHAVGAAYAMNFRKETGRAVLCSFGEGATSEGEWHESINFAAIHQLPIVFLCENNAWAISTPRRTRWRNDIIQKADGYGIPGVKVDGIDPIAVYKAAKAAMDRARSGGGPTLIEAKCYRFLSHTTDDDDRTYRPREDVERHRNNDPLPLFERFLLERGLVTADDVAAMKKEVLALVNDVTDRAEALPFPDPSRSVWQRLRRNARTVAVATPGTTTMNNVEAVRNTLHEALKSDPMTLIMGEDVGARGNVFLITKGFLEEFGPERIIDTPLAEASIVGVAVGMAMEGLRPIAEIQFADFIYPAFNQIVGEAAKTRYRCNGDYTCPLVIRTPYGGGVRGALSHSVSIEALFYHVPGSRSSRRRFPPTSKAC